MAVLPWHTRWQWRDNNFAEKFLINFLLCVFSIAVPWLIIPLYCRIFPQDVLCIHLRCWQSSPQGYRWHLNSRDAISKRKKLTNSLELVHVLLPYVINQAVLSHTGDTLWLWYVKGKLYDPYCTPCAVRSGIMTKERQDGAKIPHLSFWPSAPTSTPHPTPPLHPHPGLTGASWGPARLLHGYLGHGTDSKMVSGHGKRQNIVIGIREE